MKRLTLSNIEWVNKEFRKFGASFLEEDFLKEYRFEGRSVSGKILVWWDIEESETEGIKDELKLDGFASSKRALNEKGKANNVIGKYKGWVKDRGSKDLASSSMARINLGF